MTRRLIARTAGPLLLACLLGLSLWAASFVADGDAADPGVGAADASSAFEAAYATFQDDFDDGAEIAAARDADLAERTASVRAVRLAFSEFDTTVATITMPPGAIEDVTAMHVAIEDLIVKFDLQGATTTVPAYQEANGPAAAAYTAARAAIEKVRGTLRALSQPTAGPDETPVALPTPGALQPSLAPEYVVGTRVLAAIKWRDQLLDVALANVDARYVDNDSLGIRAGWIAAFPDVLTDDALVDAGFEAPVNGVSGLVVRVPDPSEPASRENPPYLAFAVRDDDGTCAGGVISGYPAMTTTIPVAIAGDEACTGRAAAAAAGFPVG